jgi:hypothetical protein
MPLFSSVAVCEWRAVFRLLLKTKPTVTVKVVEPLTVPNAALIVVVPNPAAVAKPCEPDALLIVVTPGADELHVAVLVRFCVLLHSSPIFSLYRVPPLLPKPALLPRPPKAAVPIRELSQSRTTP